MEPIKTHVLSELKRLGVWASGKTLSPPLRRIPAFQQITKVSSLLKQPDLQRRVIHDGIQSSIDELSGTRLAPSQSQFLISLPNQGDWTLDALNWHTDLHARGNHALPGIQAFILIDDVKPHGGATLAIAGSHLPKHRTPDNGVRAVLRQGGDIESELRRRNVSMIEMCGNAGDVYLMDMRTLHTPSINSTPRVRMMATVRYLPES